MCDIGAEMREVEFEPLTGKTSVNEPAPQPVWGDRDEPAPQRG